MNHLNALLNKIKLKKQYLENLEYHISIFKLALSNQYLSFYPLVSIPKIENSILLLETKFNKENIKLINLYIDYQKNNIISETIKTIEEETIEETIEEEPIEEETIEEETIEEETTEDEKKEEIPNDENEIKREFLINFYEENLENKHVKFLEHNEQNYKLCYLFLFKSKNKVFNNLKDKLDEMNFKYEIVKSGTLYFIKIIDTI